MRGKKLFEQYTLQSVLDELNLFERYEVPGKRLQVAEVLKKQTELYHNLDITPPVSL